MPSNFADFNLDCPAGCACAQEPPYHFVLKSRHHSSLSDYAKPVSKVIEIPQWADKDAKVCAALQYSAAQTKDQTGGKAKPLKAPKKEKKDMDEEEVAFKAKQAADAKARKDMAEKAKGKGMCTPIWLERWTDLTRIAQDL